MNICDVYDNAKRVFQNSIFREDCNILFSTENACEYGLNAVAVSFLAAVLNNDNFQNTVNVLSKQYKVSNEIIEKDLFNFLRKFSSMGKITNANGMKEKDYQLEKRVAIEQVNAPFSIEFELTKVCNYRCPFCYNTWKYHEVENVHMSCLAKEKIFDVLDQCKKMKVFKVRYSGGEPTLYPYLDEIVEYASKFNLYQSIFTNAYCLDDKRIDYWMKSGVKEVLVSLHGLEEQHDSITGLKGSFSKTCINIKKLISTGIHVVVEMTLVSHNIGEVDAVLNKVFQLGVTEFRVMKYVANGIESLDRELSVTDYDFELVMKKVFSHPLYKENKVNVTFPCSQTFCDSAGNVYKDDSLLLYNCRAGINWVAISYKGDVKICPHSADKFGNVYDDDFSLYDTWQFGTRKEVLSILESRDNKCKVCESWVKCYGGCLIR